MIKLRHCLENFHNNKVYPGLLSGEFSRFIYFTKRIRVTVSIISQQPLYPFFLNIYIQKFIKSNLCFVEKNQISYTLILRNIQQMCMRDLRSSRSQLSFLNFQMAMAKQIVFYLTLTLHILLDVLHAYNYS